MARAFRVLIELLHIAAGVMAAALIGAGCAWAYPIGADNIWIVTYASMAVVVLLGIGPVRRAWTGEDKQEEERTHG